MADIRNLLAAQQPAQRPTSSVGGNDIFKALEGVAGTGLGAVASVGNFLDLPGSSVRDLLAGENPFDQWLTPLSDENRVTGRQLLERRLGMRKNRETGISGWLSDPGEGLRDLAGFAAEIVTDPFGPVTKGLMAGTSAGKALAQSASRAHPIMRAVGRGAVNVFDKIPGRVQEAIFKPPARAVKALFNAPTMGVTNDVVQPMAEAAHAATTKSTKEAMLNEINLMQTADKIGWHLTPDLTLDASDPKTWANPRSQFQVNARELALYRYREMGDEFIPSTGGYTKGDMVTIGETPDFHEVEWVNSTPQGLQIKLVGQDQPLMDGQLKPAFMQTQVEVPPEIRELADISRVNDIDTLNTRLNELGVIGAGKDHDVLQHYSARQKAVKLKQIEEILGVRMEPDRRQYAGLTSTLTANGGRDALYKGNHEGTAGVIRMFEDAQLQHVINSVDDIAVESPELIKGVRPKIIPGKLGPRHLDPLAEALGMEGGDELWDLARIGIQDTRKTMALVTPLADGHRVIENGRVLGKIQTTVSPDGEAFLFPQISGTTPQTDILEDILPHIERELQQSGVKRSAVITTPEMGESFWKGQGYRAEKTDGTTDKWVKDLYTAAPGSDPYLSAARMADQKEVVEKLTGLALSIQQQVKAGLAPGVQPGQGWWKRFDDLRDPTGEKVINFNPAKEGFVKLDSSTIQPGMFPDPADYSLAQQHLSKGKEVYYGFRKPKRGEPAVATIVSPTSDAKIMLRLDKFIAELPDNVKASPLLKTEATYDQLHQSITRNWGGRVDRWMAELDDNGVAKASDFSQVVHADTPNAWRKALPDLIERVQNSKPLNKPTSALLRLDDDSLQALGFSKENIDMVAEMRQTIAETTGADISQDVSVSLVDRHRGLAEEVADHVEKRMAPIFSRSSAVASYDYVKKNAAAKNLLEAMQGTVIGLYKSNGGAPVAKDIIVSADMSKKLGETLGEALDEKGGALFGGKVSPQAWLEDTRKQFVREKLTGFTDTLDPDEIRNQIEIIKGIRAPKEVFEQMRTLNEVSAAADLPEAGFLGKIGGTLMSWWKAGMLATSPATTVRDGFGSYVNSIIMGDANPVSMITTHLPKGSAFARGNLVDPGDGVPEIVQFLAKYGRENTAENRAQAFQAMYAAHHAGGGVHPNVIRADEAAMEGADSTAAFGKDIPNYGDPKTMLDMLTKQPVEKFKEFLSTPGKFNWRNLATGNSPLSPANVAGAWKWDQATNRMVQNSTNNVITGTMNAFRGHVDTTVRAAYILEQVSKGKSLTEALANSDRVLMNANPRNFTRFEHKYLKNLVPFYSFMRQSIPMFLKELAVNPGGKLGAVVRGTRLGQGNDQGYVPFQYQDTASIPLGKNEDGSYKYLTSFGLMHEDAISYAGNALQRDLRGSLQKMIAGGNPAVKWLIEYSTNTSLYSQGPMGGRRLDDLDPSIGRLLTNIGVQDLDPSGRAAPVLGSATIESIAAASPVSRMISMAKIATNDPKRAGTVEKLARLLTGVRIENVSPEQITRDIRDRINALQVQAGARPLTTVIGANADEVRARGDVETADKLDQYASVLKMISRMEREKKKAAVK